MKQCQFCKAMFASEDAYQIHLGIGAPTFHACNDETEMAAKGMTKNRAGEWNIDKSLITHQEGWAYLKPVTTLETQTSEQTETTKKPYNCSDCGKPLAFPETFFYQDKPYCSNHLPQYDKHEQW